MTATVSTGWAEVEAGIVRDARAGVRVSEIARASGWSVYVVRKVLRAHGIHLCPRGESWTNEEKAVIRDAVSPTDAIVQFRARYPDSARTKRSIASKWDRMQAGAVEA
jgi:hypothetical protein